MAYDIHIEANGLSESEQYQYGVPEEIHSYIFDVLKAKQINMPFFNRFSDYYCDATFKTEELEKLVKDLNGLIGFFYENKEVTDMLCELKNTARKAQKLKGRLVGYSD